MKLIIDGKELEYCPQHGYPLPCDKCGLGQFELGKQAGIKEVVEWINENNGRPDHILDLWQSKLKSWNISD